MNSILQSSKRCFVCGTIKNIHCHHVFSGVAHRKISDQEGLTIYLCAKHHNMSDEGIHFNKELDLRVKQMAQTEWLVLHHNDLDKWYKLFHRSWL